MRGAAGVVPRVRASWRYAVVRLSRVLGVLGHRRLLAIASFAAIAGWGVIPAGGYVKTVLEAGSVTAVYDLPVEQSLSPICGCFMRVAPSRGVSVVARQLDLAAGVAQFDLVVMSPRPGPTDIVPDVSLEASLLAFTLPALEPAQAESGLHRRRDLATEKGSDLRELASRILRDGLDAQALKSVERKHFSNIQLVQIRDVSAVTFLQLHDRPVAVWNPPPGTHATVDFQAGTLTQTSEVSNDSRFVANNATKMIDDGPVVHPVLDLLGAPSIILFEDSSQLLLDSEDAAIVKAQPPAGDDVATRTIWGLAVWTPGVARVVPVVSADRRDPSWVFGEDLEEEKNRISGAYLFQTRAPSTLTLKAHLAAKPEGSSSLSTLYEAHFKKGPYAGLVYLRPDLPPGGGWGIWGPLSALTFHGARGAIAIGEREMTASVPRLIGLDWLTPGNSSTDYLPMRDGTRIEVDSVVKMVSTDGSPAHRNWHTVDAAVQLLLSLTGFVSLVLAIMPNRSASKALRGLQ